MSMRKELIASGEMYAGAVAVGGSTELGVTLTTAMTTQANGYQFTKANTIVTVSGATGNAAVLPLCEQGDWIQVANFTGNALSIYPPLGWGIHGLGQNAVYSLPANKTASFTTVTDPNRPFPQGNGAFSYNQFLAMQG